ncbi:MAG: hypothetical protein WBA43_05495 [Elainellaceae cyanobacterium]
MAAGNALECNALGAIASAMMTSSDRLYPRAITHAPLQSMKTSSSETTTEGQASMIIMESMRNGFSFD